MMQRWHLPPLKRLGAALAVILALVLVSIATSAQDTSASLFGEVIDVRVVNLEIVVTQGGQRVSGLNPEDFLLTVDGKEIPVEYFTEVSGGTATGHTQGAARLGTVPALAPGQPVGTSYLIFVDEFFTSSKQRNRVLRRMIEQLPMMTPEDRMAVVAFNGRRLDMLSTWSQSTEALTRVFEDALNREAYGSQRFSERRLMAPDAVLTTERASRLEEFEQPSLLGAGFTVGSDMLTIEEEQLIELLTEDVERLVMAASSTLRSFASPPGRKVMMMLSGGWPSTPAQLVVPNPNRALYISGFSHGRKLYGPLIETANRLSYTLYPIDVPLRPDEATNATDPDGEEILAPDGSLVNETGTISQGFNNIQDQRATLKRLAVDTGGKAIFANNALQAIEQVVTDTRSYYWIGFTPLWKGNDEAHKIDVQVRKRGMKVRSRRNFSDLSRAKEVTMMVESALRLGDSPTAVPFPARIGEIKRAGRGKVNVPLEMLVPMEALTFLPYQDRYVAEAELRVAVQDEEGTLADIPVVPLKITMDAPPKQGDMRRWTTHVKMRRQIHDVVLSLYDNASGTILSTKLKVDPL